MPRDRHWHGRRVNKAVFPCFFSTAGGHLLRSTMAAALKSPRECWHGRIIRPLPSSGHDKTGPLHRLRNRSPDGMADARAFLVAESEKLHTKRAAA